MSKSWHYAIQRRHEMSKIIGREYTGLYRTSIFRNSKEGNTFYMQFAVWHTEISNSTEYLTFKSGIPPTFPQKQHLSIYFMMKVGIAVCLPNSILMKHHFPFQWHNKNVIWKYHTVGSFNSRQFGRLAIGDCWLTIQSTAQGPNNAEYTKQ